MVSIVVSFLSFLVATIIGFRQLHMTAKQGAFQKEMLTAQDSFMRKQSALMHEQTEISKRDARVAAERSADAYLRDHYADRGLVPLAAMAAIFGGDRPFKRQLYRDFLLLSPSAQDHVFKRLNLTRPVFSGSAFWDEMVRALNDKYRQFFPKDKDVLYDNAKYLAYAFTVYGSEPLPSSWGLCLPESVARVCPKKLRFPGTSCVDSSKITSRFEHRDALTDVLVAAFRGEVFDPLHLMSGNLMPGSSSIETSYADCLFFGYFASYVGLRLRDPDVEAFEYGSPGAWDGEVFERMEDVFLWCLFEIYTNLMLPEMKHNNEEITTP